ncbi:extracellular solute-binding protein [Arthrobacter sp. RHLT1-20]
MRQRRRTWQTLLATTASLTVAAVALTGCGGTATEAKSTSKAAAASFEGKGPINYVSNRDASGAANKTIEEWNAAHPEEKVTFIELPDSADQQRQQLIQNAQIKSDTFSVLNLDVVWTSEFAANKWILPLPADAVPTDKMIPATVNAATYRDILVGAPYYTDGALFYFRSDLLKAAGIAAAPKTWEEMKTACKAILALPEAAGISCYTGQFDKNEALTVNFSEAVASAGGTVVDADGKPTVNTPEAKEGLKLLVDGFKDGLFPSDAITYLEEQGRRAFQDGKLVFMRNWPFLHASLSATDGSSKVAGKFDITSIPGTDGPRRLHPGRPQPRHLSVHPEQGHSAGVRQVLHQRGTSPEASRAVLPRPRLRLPLRGSRRRRQAPVLPHPADLAEQRPAAPQGGPARRHHQGHPGRGLRGHHRRQGHGHGPERHAGQAHRAVQVIRQYRNPVVQ